MALLLPPTGTLRVNLILTAPQWEGDQRIYPLAGLRLPRHASPWDACEACMLKGYLPPFDLVRELHEEEVGYGDIARRLWILRGARRTAQLVQEAAQLSLRQVGALKKTVQGWRQSG